MDQEDISRGVDSMALKVDGVAPVVLFVYNRPWHTRQTIEALCKNPGSRDSDLIVFSDGPKDAASESKVKEVRQYLRSIQGFKTIRIIEREQNIGLASNIISGVTDVVDEYHKVIVLEDDIVTSPYFLQYMNDALDYYQDKEKVMHISGYMFPVNPQGLKETFFYRSTSCWGWATWKRAWDYFEKNVDKLFREFSKKDIKAFNLDGYCDFWQQVIDNKKQKIDTWAIFWYASVFKNKGLCLHPSVSLVKNIGHDRSGTHCGDSNIFDGPLVDAPISYFETNISESQLALSKMQEFYRHAGGTLLRRICAATKRLLLPKS